MEEIENTLIPLKIVLDFLENRLSDEKVLDDYRDIMVRGVQASYTSVKELKDDITNLAIEYNKNK